MHVFFKSSVDNLTRVQITVADKGIVNKEIPFSFYG